MNFPAALQHLRLHFSLLLAPVFLLGGAFAGAEASLSFWILFFAFHVFLYGGSHAINAAFDRDTGPVGGMYHPPPVPRGLFLTGVLLKLAGLLLSLLSGLTAAIIYLAYAVLSTAYSHPAIRLKRYPVLGALTVMIGQGLLPFLAAWSLGDAAWGLSEGFAVSATALLMLSLYPLSQIYQHDEDAARGDRTLSILLGVRGTFRFALIIGVLGALLLFLAVRLWLGIAPALPILLFLPGLGVGLMTWERRFPQQTLRERFQWLMGMSYTNALVFSGYIVVLMLL